VLAALREPRAVLVALLFVGSCEAALLGAMGWAGAKLNLVLVILPPVLFVIALATSVHLLVGWRSWRASGLATAEAVAATWREKGWAVLFTGVTTLIGFGSLATSRVPPVRSLGLWAAAGLGLLTIAAFTLLPALVLELERRSPMPSPTRFERLLAAFGRSCGEACTRRRRLVLALALALGLLGLAGLPRLRLETNALRYLDPTRPARSGIERIERAGIGSSAVELVLAHEDGRPWSEPEALSALSALARELTSEPLVLGVVGPGDVVDSVARELSGAAPFEAIPAEAREEAIDELLLSPRRRELLEPLLSPDSRRARLSVFTRLVGFVELDPLVESATAAARERLPGARVVATGQYPLLQRVQRRLFETLGTSLGITLVAIALVFRLILGGARITLLAMVPNVLPVLVVLGAMGWAGVPLDVATVMVSSVVLGLAVDDTIHTLGHHRELSRRHGARIAAIETLERTAGAYVLTGLVLGLGFATCALSDFAPTARFGALAALGVFAAVLCDLTLLPALLGGERDGGAPRRPGRAQSPRAQSGRSGTEPPSAPSSTSSRRSRSRGSRPPSGR
jgi:predicted RND superfamily exporter protein